MTISHWENNWKNCLLSCYVTDFKNPADIGMNECVWGLENRKIEAFEIFFVFPSKLNLMTLIAHFCIVCACYDITTACNSWGIF